MKLNFKTLTGTSFEIEASPGDSVSEVKKIIETTQQAQGVYPADQQMLIHQGKVLKDGTTLESNNVSDNSSLLIMLSNAKASSTAASTATAGKAPASPNESVAPVACVASETTTPACQAPVAAAPSRDSSNTSKSNLDWDWKDSDDEIDWEDSDDETDLEDSDDTIHKDPFDMESLPPDLRQKIISFTSPLDALRIAMFPDLRQDAYSNIVWDSFLRSFRESNEERVDLDHQLAIISAATPSLTVREKFGQLFEPKFVADQSMTVWLDKKTVAKCYMLVARTSVGANQSYWRWIPCDRLRPPLFAAELLPRTNQLEISGTMASTLLSEGSTYAAYMVFKFKVGSTLIDSVQESVVSIGEYQDANLICFGAVRGNIFDQPQKRRDGWMEIKLGEFGTEDGDDSPLHIQVILDTGDQLMKGLIMLGIEIRVAKWRASSDASDHEKS